MGVQGGEAAVPHSGLQEEASDPRDNSWIPVTCESSPVEIPVVHVWQPDSYVFFMYASLSGVVHAG